MRRTAVIFLGALVLALGAVPSALAVCPSPVPYPGDDAGKESLAQWMASGAAAREIPPELPVMAALVESGLANLSYGDRDSVGFFQMRLRYWNQGEYAGYPDNPELQLDWFVDHALTERDRRIARGAGLTELDYGEWIADVEKPAAQYRGRYQLRLAEARELIGFDCTVVAPAPALVTLDGAPAQRTLHRRAMAVRVGCPIEACSITGRASVRAMGQVFPVTARPLELEAAQGRVLRFPIHSELRRAVRQALRWGRPVRVRVAVSAVGESAATGTERWTARVSR